MNTHLAHLVSYMGSLKGKRVLDLGAGKGNFLITLTKEGSIATGLEINPAYIDEAYERAREENITIDLREGKAESLPFANDSFDAANVSEVIEHVQSPERMLNELHRVLVPGGKAYMSVPNRFSLRDPHFHIYFVNWLPRSMSDGFISFFGHHKEYGDTSAGHQRLSEMHYYRYPQICRLLAAQGFTVTDIREQRILTMSWLKRLALSLAYPLARTIYFDSFHLLLTKPQGTIQPVAPVEMGAKHVV